MHYVNAEIVWRGPEPGLQYPAWLQEAAVRFTFGQLEPHGYQFPGCWSFSVHWTQFSPAFLSLFSITNLDLVTWCFKPLAYGQTLISCPLTSEPNYDKEFALLFHSFNILILDIGLPSQMKGISFWKFSFHIFKSANVGTQLRRRVTWTHM